MEEISLKAELTDEEMRGIFGMRDAYIKKIESSMNVRVVSRNGYLYVYGSEENASRAMSVIMDLKDYTGKVGNLEEQSVDYAIEEASDNNGGVLSETLTDQICHTAAGKPVFPKTLGQKQYVSSIRDKMITFGTMMSGLLVGAGIGLLVLFRVNDNKKENIRIAILLFLIGTVVGALLDVLGIAL